MGGLVLRAALNNNSDLIDKVKGVIHVMQPAAGAPVFYRRFYTGNQIPVDDPGIGILGFPLGFSPLNIILGESPQAWATMVSAMRGPTELIPTPRYSDGVNHEWINFFTILGSPVALAVRQQDFFPYLELGHPPALVDQLDFINSDPTVIEDIAKRVGQAKTFHDKLGLFNHPNTWAIFSTGVETDTAFFRDQNTNMDFDKARSLRGDGTVPETSASILFPSQRHKLGDLCKGDPRQFEVTGVDHADGMLSAEIQTLIKAIVEKMLGLRCFEPPPAPPSPQPSTSVEEPGTKVFEESTEDHVFHKPKPCP
jgi:hypothetical protein